MIFSRDTRLEAERIMVDLMRRATIGRKWVMLDEQCALAHALARSGLKMRHPEAAPAELEARFYDLILGPVLGQRVLAAKRARDSHVKSRVVATPTEVLRHVVQLLDELHVPYVIGGSFASSAYGEARSTRDADLVVELRLEQAQGLASRLERDFYVDRDAMAEAIRDHGIFNAIHLESMFKIDFFILGPSAFDHEEFRRRVAHSVEELGDQTWFIKTPEDTILRKLEWYRSGGEVSDQQWRDVLGVLAVWRGRLDDAYLERWAAELRVSDLLERARRTIVAP